MVTAYWQIGRVIVEHEQQGKKKAAYGKSVLKDLSVRLTADFGRGLSVDNLENLENFTLLSHPTPFPTLRVGNLKRLMYWVENQG